MNAILPVKWTSLRYHPQQAAAWKSKKKYVVLVAGRGSGKTEIARRKTVISLAVKKEWPDPLYAYCLPTFSQAKKVAWDPIVQLIPPQWIRKNGINVSDMTIKTIFGSTLYIVGMDKPQRMEGLQFDRVIIDESSDQKPGVFEKSISPTLNHRDGQCWRIGVPKRSGIGRVEFRKFFDKGIKGASHIDSYTWKSSTVLTSEQLEAAKEITDTQQFEEQYNAVWLDAGGSIYHAYSDQNLFDGAVYDPILPIYVGSDFNVDPMCWTLGHKRGEHLDIFEEVFLRNTHTEKTLNYLHGKYGSHLAGWNFYGDASGRARKTSTGRTDYLLIKNDARFVNKKVFYPKKNPLVKDRHATVNAALCNAKGERRIRIHPSCTYLINDLEMMSYVEGTTEVEDYSGTDIGHISDGFGYCIMRVYPMRLHRTSIPSVVVRT